MEKFTDSWRVKFDYGSCIDSNSKSIDSGNRAIRFNFSWYVDWFFFAALGLYVRCKTNDGTKVEAARGSKRKMEE